MVVPRKCQGDQFNQQCVRRENTIVGSDQPKEKTANNKTARPRCGVKADEGEWESALWKNGTTGLGWRQTCAPTSLNFAVSRPLQHTHCFFVEHLSVRRCVSVVSRPSWPKTSIESAFEARER
jgi:hypothetical protein